MPEGELCDRLLELATPWFFADVKGDAASQQVDLFFEHAQGALFSCPGSGMACLVYEHTAKRQSRKLDTMQFKAMLYARPPRVECEEHGIKRRVGGRRNRENLKTAINPFYCG